MISKDEAIKALDRIWNFCEEIDFHLTPEERTGYKMLPDYQTVRKYLEEDPEVIACGECELTIENEPVNKLDVLDVYTDLYWTDERTLSFREELNKVFDRLLNLPLMVIPVKENSQCKDCKYYKSNIEYCNRNFKAIWFPPDGFCNFWKAKQDE